MGGPRHGHNPKRGGGGLRHRHKPKNGVLGTETSREQEVIRTGLVNKRILVSDVAQKGVLGSIFINFLTFVLSTLSTGGGLL